MSSIVFRWSVPFLVSAFTFAFNGSHGSLPELVVKPGMGVAYFEPPRSIGIPIEDVVRLYTGYGLAAKIEGRLRLETDTSLDATTRELIRRRLARET